jgi:S-adenosylmethionine decarboxylase proenzyme
MALDMRGLHLTADLHGCAAGRAAMTDPEALRTLCRAAIAAAGLTAVAEVFHRFEPGPDARAGTPVGITGVLLLAESHVAVHTWPELDAATVDVYVCNLGQDNSARAEALLGRLIEGFAPMRTARHALERGRLR